MKKIIKELKRRNVIKATIAYLVVAWVLLQVAETVLPIVEAPEWILKGLVFFLAIGLPIWVVISWIYDITPQGIEKTSKGSEDQLISQITNKRLNIFILVGVVIAAIVLALNISIFSSEKQNTIAILPFEDLISDQGNEWLSKGFTSEIHTYISKIKNLTVISKFAVNEALKDTTVKTINEIAKALGASYILKGEVRQMGNDMFITANLTNVNSNMDEWGGSYDESLDDPFKIQQEVAKKIVQQLKITMSTEEAAALNISPTHNKDAYRLFLQGRAIADTRDHDNFDLAIEYYNKAIASDPNYAVAYAELAHIKFLQNGAHINAEIEALNEKALKINPNTARVYSTRAVAYTEMDNEHFEEAIENFEKALEINPNDDTAHHHLAYYYSLLPIPDVKKQLFHIRKAQKLNPVSSPINNVFLYALLNNDKVKEAEEQLEKAKSSFKNSDIEEFKGLIKSHQKKDFTEAISHIHKAIEVNPNDPWLYWMLGGYYNDILNDDANYLKYSKKAFELDATNFRFKLRYYKSLLENKKFKEAKEAKELFNNDMASSRYYFATDSLEKALSHIIKTNNRFTTEIKLSILAKMGERDSINAIFKNNVVYYGDKAVVYAILKETDSMYHYLNKIDSKPRIQYINGNNAFNPYRNQPKYKTILRKNYFPTGN